MQYICNYVVICYAHLHKCLYVLIYIYSPSISIYLYHLYDGAMAEVRGYWSKSVKDSGTASICQEFSLT